MKPQKLLKIGLLLTSGFLTATTFAQGIGDAGSGPRSMINSLANEARAAVTFAQETADTALGLQKGSVFDTHIPDIPAFPEAGPGRNDFYGASHSAEPPQIPHNVDKFLPIKMGTNRCVSCHDKPMLIGKVRGRKGLATPAPASHYMDWRNDSSTQGKKLQGSRYLCVQCHRPQANAPALVENTFSN